MKPLKEDLEEKLQTNNSWVLGCPGIKGLSYAEALEKWKVKKIITVRQMVKDLEEMEAEKGSVFTTLVRSMIAREIAVAKWQASCGTFPIWKGILSKAKNRATKNLYGQSPLDNLTEGIFKNGKSKPTAEQRGVQSTTAGLGGRTVSPGSHDAERGGDRRGFGGSERGRLLPGGQSEAV